MVTAQKPYKGMAMEGPIASWYAKNTARDTNRFLKVARLVTSRVAPGARVLEVAPGPGYLAVELAKSGLAVSAVDISKSFVDITRENARNAGVTIDVRQGNASEMPLEDGRFDYVVCMAAFKNFTDPLGALNEMHRVLAPGRQASIFDLRKDASLEDIDAGVRGLQLSAWNAFVTRWVFRTWLLKKAYTRENLEQMAMSSRFHGGEIFADGIGFELRLRKE